MQRVLAARGLYPNQLIDDRTELIDTWSDFDGDLPDDTNVGELCKNLDTTASNVNQNTIAVSALVGNIVQEDSSAWKLNKKMMSAPFNAVQYLSLERGAH